LHQAAGDLSAAAATADVHTFRLPGLFRVDLQQSNVEAVSRKKRKKSRAHDKGGLEAMKVN
jgi:hypothetical protein